MAVMQMRLRAFLFAIVLTPWAPITARTQSDFSDSLKDALNRGVVTLSIMDAANNRLRAVLGFVVDGGRVVTDLNALRGASKVLIQGGGVAAKNRSAMGLVAYSEKYGIAVLPARADSTRALRLLPILDQVTAPLAVATGTRVVLPVEWMGMRSVRTASGDTAAEVGVLDGFVPSTMSGAPVVDRDGRVVGMARHGGPDDRFPLVATHAYDIRVLLDNEPTYYALAFLDKPTRGRWRLATRLDSGAVFLDRESVEQVRPGIYSMWLKTVMDEPEAHPDGSKITHRVSQYEIDCRKTRARYRRRHYVAYADARVVSSSEATDTTWTPLIPDSVGENMFSGACTLVNSTRAAQPRVRKPQP